MGLSKQSLALVVTTTTNYKKISNKQHKNLNNNNILSTQLYTDAIKTCKKDRNKQK